MGTVSVSVSEDLREKMKQFTFINWSQVASEAFEKMVKDMETLDSITSKSKLTEQDALEIGRKINKGIAKRFRELARKKGES